MPAASIQIFGVLGHRPFEGGDFQVQLVIVPIIVVALIGVLLGRVAVLGRRLSESSQKFRAVADVAEEFIYLRSIDGHYEYVSPSCKTLCGVTQEEFYGTPGLMDQLIHPDDRERWLAHIHKINRAGEPEHFDIRLLRRDGQTVWISHVCRPVYDATGEQTGVRSSNLDITERKLFEERIERMAYFDPLTELPNRRSLTETVNQLVARSTIEHFRFAVLFMDMERFKYINDCFGHHLGDRLLVQLSARLRDQTDGYGTVFRFGGDEFVIVIPDSRSHDEAIGHARALIEVAEKAFLIDDRELYISGAIGIALFPSDGHDTETLVRHADAAMYQSKRGAAGKVHLYNPKTLEAATTLITTETKLRKGLEKDEFVVYYQPQIALADESIVGMEALVRWCPPGGECVLPAHFIPIAEETGLILALGERVLSMVGQQLVEWERAGIAVPVAVNVSGRQFMSADFCDRAEDILRQSGCTPHLLEVEITEQVFMQNLDETRLKLARFRKLGIRVALDDFGTGYSSLRYLSALPIDTIKIDRDFIWEGEKNDKDRAVLRAIAELCRNLDIAMIAEGVETASQRALVESLQCKIAQGFLFHRPMPAERLGRLLLEQREKSGRLG